MFAALYVSQDFLLVETTYCPAVPVNSHLPVVDVWIPLVLSSDLSLRRILTLSIYPGVELQDYAVFKCFEEWLCFFFPLTQPYHFIFLLLYRTPFLSAFLSLLLPFLLSLSAFLLSFLPVMVATC